MKGEARKAPQPDNDNKAEDSTDEPYLITLPADRMRRVDPSHPDAQRAAAVFAELFCMTCGKEVRKDPRLANALRVVRDALGVSRDQFHVALADLLGIPVDAI